MAQNDLWPSKEERWVKGNAYGSGHPVENIGRTFPVVIREQTGLRSVPRLQLNHRGFSLPSRLRRMWEGLNGYHDHEVHERLSPVAQSRSHLSTVLSIGQESFSRLGSPGNRRESLILSINAKSGKWFKQASHVSSRAFRAIMAILDVAKVR